LAAEVAEETGDTGRETEAERIDRNLTELLQELRIAGLGVQVLFGFLLSLPFTSKFSALDRAQRNLYVFENDGVQIEQQQAFQVELNPTLVQGGAFTTQALAPAGGQFAGSGIKLWANLEGTLARAVQ